MWLYLLVGLVALQRLGELWLSRRNTNRLLAAGGREVGRGHYPILVAVHVAWLGSLLVFVDPATPPQGHWLAVFLALQAARIWVIASLGTRWTTRIVVLPDAPLVRRGPYRWMRHPNYAVVAAEIIALPLIFGAWHMALAFTLINGGALAYRIHVEDRALGRG